MINWSSMPAFFSIREVAFIYGVPVRTIRHVVERGGLPSVRFSGPRGKRFIPAEAVLDRYPGTRESLEIRLARLNDDVLDDAA